MFFDAWLKERTVFVESAIGEVNRWTYELEDCDA